MRPRQRCPFAKLRHVRPQIVHPNLLGVPLFTLTPREKQHVRLHSLRVKNPRRQPQNRVQITLIHQVAPDFFPDPTFEQHVIGQHHRRPPTGLKATVDVLHKTELFVARRKREVRPSRKTAAFFRPKRRVSEHQRRLGQPGAIVRKGVPVSDPAVDAVEHQVHHREAMRVLHMFHPEKRLALIFLLLSLGQAVEIVVFTQVMIRRNQEAPSPGRRILDDIVERRFHHCHHAVDELARREILTGPGFLFVGVLFEQPFVEVAQPFFAGGIPIEFGDVADECR